MAKSGKRIPLNRRAVPWCWAGAVDPVFVSDLDFPNTQIAGGIKACLERAGIETIDELVQHAEIDLIRLHSFGRKKLNAVNAELARYGLSLSSSICEARP